MASFDIVCEIDIQEVTNAVDQARREIDNRYDFKGSNCEITFDKTKPALMITADDEMKMQTTIDILLTKLIKRSVPVKSLVYGKTEPSGRVQKKGDYCAARIDQRAVQNDQSIYQIKQNQSSAANSERFCTCQQQKEG